MIFNDLGKNIERVLTKSENTNESIHNTYTSGSQSVFQGTLRVCEDEQEV